MHHFKLTVIVLCVLCVATALASAQRQETIVPTEPNQSVSVLHQVRWSPYAVGAGIGVLSVLTFLLSNETIGVSGAFSSTSGMIEKLFKGRHVEQKEYYQKNPPAINWEWLFVAGLVIGSFVSAQLSGDFQIVWVPQRWLQSAGDSRLLRWAMAFLGGVVMGFGARWARGCTSGHGISGTLQLAVSSWIVTLALFGSGILMAMILFHVILG
jgi:uncharacterized membrane protein YedE/YeeE